MIRSSLEQMISLLEGILVGVNSLVNCLGNVFVSTWIKNEKISNDSLFACTIWVALILKVRLEWKQKKKKSQRT